MLAEELGAAAGAAAVTGNIAGFVTQLGDFLDQAGHHIEIDTATAGTVKADFDALSKFYGALSDLHAQLRTKMATLKGQALDLHTADAAGKVAGVQKAWASIGHSAGIMEHAGSLYGNLRTIDHWVLYYMSATLHNAQNYAQNEGKVIQSFGRAGDADVPVPTRTSGSKSGSAPSSSRSGW